MSGLLFALAINPLLGELYERIDQQGAGITRACADDIGICLRAIRHLVTVYDIFAKVECVSGLCLKMSES